VALGVAEVVGLDPRLVAGMSAGQRDPAAAARMQVAGMHGVAVAGQAVAAVVVDHRRDEMQLDVGAIVFGQRRAQEGAAFGDVAGAGTASAAQEVVEGQPKLIGAVVAGAPGLVLQGAHVEMVLQVGAHAAARHHGVDPVPAQLGLRPDARQHQQLRRVDGAPAQDHFARGPMAERRAPLRAGHADGALPVEEEALDHRTGAHGQVRSRPCRIEVGHCGGTACAVALGDLVQADAELRCAVEVVVARQACLLGGFDEDLRKLIDIAQVRDRQRAVAGVQRIAAARVAFRTPEVGQHVRPVPVVGALRRPAVVVLGHTADVAHGIDRAGAAEHLAARPPDHPVAELGFGNGVVVPVDAPVAGDLGQSGRHVDEGMPVAPAGLQQQHPASRVFGQAVGKHAAGRTRADDDVVVGVAHVVVGAGHRVKLGSAARAYALRAVARGRGHRLTCAQPAPAGATEPG